MGHKMTPEKYLTRYKVIADYPFSPYKIGDIICPGENHVNFIAAQTESYCLVAPITYLDKMTAIYRRVEWWEGLEPEEMPQYVKLKEKSFLTAEILEAGTIIKVLKHFTSSNGEVNLRGCQIFGNDFLAYFKTEPATKEQYEEYIKQKA
jgi:hypothetical protein